MAASGSKKETKIFVEEVKSAQLQFKGLALKEVVRRSTPYLLFFPLNFI